MQTEGRGKQSSDFKGVSWYARTGKWQAFVRVGNKVEHLGYYESEEMAAQAHDIRALAVFGDRAILNDPFGLTPQGVRRGS